MSKWNTILLKDACAKIGSGATPRGGKEAYKGGATTLIRSQNIYNEGFHRDGLVHIDNQQAAELDNVEIRPGDVLLNITGDSVARCCQVAADVLPARVNQHVAIIRPRHDVLDAQFLRYVLISPPFQTHLLSLASAGATRNAITKAMIECLEVAAPPLPEQKRIAHILGTLDDKIELNRRMNATLEAMARALFKSWFVDFDPIRAKLDGRKPENMDAETAALFPSEFQDSPLGTIPKGWQIKPVGAVVECVGGSTPSTKEPKYWEGGKHHWTTPKDLSSLQSPLLIDTDRKITDAGVSAISSGLLPAGTLLLSSRAPVGYLAIATMPVAINQGFIALKCNGSASNYFMLNWCQENMAEIESRATGTTFAEISKSNFRPIPVVLPPKPLITHFSATVTSLFALILANLYESRCLVKLRDLQLGHLFRRAI